MAGRRCASDLADSLVFFLLFSLVPTQSAAIFSPPDDHLIACGATSAAALPDGRSFLSDSGLATTILRSHGRQFSLSNPSADADPLHRTARVFTCPSSYEFDIKSKGVHLIRLHFYPFQTPEFNLSSARFHVLASEITLLSDFVAPRPLLKEYFINLKEEKLVISFYPADRSSFAFVNAIEVVSAPKDLILYPARLVKAEEVAKFDGLSKQAFETLYRVNVGGPKVTPFNDSLWRTWIPDGVFLKPSSASEIVSYSGRIKYQEYGASREVAPDHVYNTARVINGAVRSGSNYSMTWEFPVTPGYKYLIRMHFCDIASLTLYQLYFNVYINGYMAYEDFDLSDSTRLLASPHYVDFVLDVDITELLSISIQPSNQSSPLWIRGLLNGLEIMKMNNTMGNLDDESPVILFSANPIKRGLGAFLRSLTCGFAFVSLSAIAFMLFLRWRSEQRSHAAWSPLPVDVSDSKLTPGKLVNF
ncbi:putative receptor-like protein kinase At5g24010 [Curcuma longa]|uniref:putative receptor-like protein kinase At5g24010 n=1 Tax=Curcuma longa TaxID=136217 RepID=UPI003D9DD42D